MNELVTGLLFRQADVKDLRLILHELPDEVIESLKDRLQELEAADFHYEFFMIGGPARVTNEVMKQRLRELAIRLGH